MPRHPRCRGFPDFLHQSDEIAAMTSVQLEERVGLRSTAATQLCENQPSGERALPDEPVSLIPGAGAPAKIAHGRGRSLSTFGAGLSPGSSRDNLFDASHFNRGGAGRLVFTSLFLGSVPSLGSPQPGRSVPRHQERRAMPTIETRAILGSLFHSSAPAARAPRRRHPDEHRRTCR